MARSSSHNTLVNDTRIKPEFRKEVSRKASLANKRLARLEKNGLTDSPAYQKFKEGGEKVSWDRKMDNMVSLLAKLKPIEDGIIDLMAKKMPIIDEITALRREMVKECVHPFTHLQRQTDGSVQCKFCSRSFKVMDTDGE